jgi:hypothetical protein
MDCRSFREQMPEYFTGTLETHRSKSLEEHLVECRECNEEFADYKSMMALISDPIEVPADFKATLRHLVSKEARKQLPTGSTWRAFAKNPFFKVLIGATAASLLLLVTGLIWFDLILPDKPQESVVIYVEDQHAGMNMLTERGLSQLVSADNATATLKLLVRYSDDLAASMDEKAMSIGAGVLNSANRNAPYALYELSPEVMSFFVNYLETLGAVDASLPRIASITSTKVFLLVEIGK